jgi:hypothetical protein
MPERSGPAPPVWRQRLAPIRPVHPHIGHLQTPHAHSLESRDAASIQEETPSRGQNDTPVATIALMASKNAGNVARLVRKIPDEGDFLYWHQSHHGAA